MINFFRNFIFFLFIFFKPFFSNSVEITNIASVDNYSITNYDLSHRVSILKKIQNKQISDENLNAIIENLINEKVKEIEINKNKIEINKQIIINQFNARYSNNFDTSTLNYEIKKFLMEKIKRDLQWNELLNKKFYNKLTVNLSEINEVIKSRNIPEEKKEEFIMMEKNKKLASISNNYFNFIKSQKYIKIY